MVEHCGDPEASQYGFEDVKRGVDAHSCHESNVRYTLQDLGFSWIQPDSGKWAVHKSRRRLIVDYVFANQEVRKLQAALGSGKTTLSSDRIADRYTA